MNPEIKAKWLEALRSGRYRQGQEALQHNGRYCCLGVLCDVVDPSGWTGTVHYVQHHGRINTPSPEFSEATRISAHAIDRLIEVNDDKGWDFNKIADWIESHL